MKISDEEMSSLPKRKQMEMKYFYPFIKWTYARFFGWYGFYWAYKLIVQDFTIPLWEQWALCFFAMSSVYFFAREERLDGFFNKKKV